MEAHLIDESLRREREEVKLAAKREELHGELAAMLYGVEAAGAVQAESAAEAVMARVQAYREIKGQIERARDDTEAPADTENETRDDSAVPWIVAPRSSSLEVDRGLARRSEEAGASPHVIVGCRHQE